MRKPLLFFLFALPLPFLLHAQSTRSEHQATYHIGTHQTVDPIVVDGRLSEATWQSAEKTNNFWMKWPRDGGPAPEQTIVQCAYDKRYLYIAAVCHDTTPRHVIQSLKRDVGYWDSDGFSVVIDPTNTANNGYFFGVNAAGVQMDALIATGREDPDFNWDNIWLAKVQQEPTQWTVEMAIPLRILRYKTGQTRWGINFIRNDLGNTIYSVWARIPFQFDGLDLGWTGALEWDQAPQPTKGNVNLIPYVSAGLSKDFEAGEDWKQKPNAGFDAKIGIGSGMNLDVTVNPDFSQVEVDQQVVNLTRFDVQLPEKRTFFLENSDLFGNFGIPPLRPFFSRRIGLDNDGNPLPILGGLRLSGNLNADTRLGIMTIQTGKTDSLPSRNNTAIAFNRRLFGRSTVSGYLLNRQNFDHGEPINEDFSRNAGLEFSFISKDGKWAAWATHHRSMKPDLKGENWWGNTGFLYNTRRAFVLTDIDHVARNYYADLGFEQRLENTDALRDTVLRIPYRFLFNQTKITFFPKKKGGLINLCELETNDFLVFNEDGSVNEFSQKIEYTFNFKKTSELTVGADYSYMNIPVHFKIDDEEDLALCPPIPPGRYSFGQVYLEYASDYRQPLFWKIEGRAGSFFNGKQYSATAELFWRIQPIMNLRIEAEYNILQFPSPYCSVNYFNITPRIEVFFGKNLWWTTFLQYNTQADNFNINSRLQWRYRPMCDLFLVYTDNYAVKFWGPKNKALALKINYWF